MKSNAIAEYYQGLRKSTTDPVLSARINEVERENQQDYQGQIDDTIKRGQTPVRFAVYGSSGDFIGYKVDTFWTLHEAFAKIHPLEANKIIELLKNFASCKTQSLKYKKERGKKPKIEKLEVSVEELDSKGEPVTIVGQYKVYYSFWRYRVKPIK